QLVYLHDPEHATFEEITAPGGALDTLLRLKASGVIEHLGVAGGPIEMEMRYVEAGTFEAVISHNRYTLVNRTADPLFDLAARRPIPDELWPQLDALAPAAGDPEVGRRRS